MSASLSRFAKPPWSCHEQDWYPSVEGTWALVKPQVKNFLWDSSSSTCSSTVAPLSALTALEGLNLHNSHAYEGLQQLPVSLTALDLGRSRDFPADDFASLSRLVRLRELNVQMTNFDTRSGQAPGLTKSLPLQEKIYLAELGPEMRAELLKLRPSLQLIQLRVVSEFQTQRPHDPITVILAIFVECNWLLKGFWCRAATFYFCSQSFCQPNYVLIIMTFLNRPNRANPIEHLQPKWSHL